MKKQDNKLVLTIEENMVGKQCFMTIRSTNEHMEECVRHQANHKVSYSLVTEIEGIATARECTHEVWMKSMVKDYVVLEEVLTSHYENLGGTKVWSHELDVLKYLSLKPTLQKLMQ